MEVSQPTDHVTHAVIGGGKTINFGISDSAEFFDILSKTLYTDQILAVVREVLCNAWDAHIAAGCADKPIQITLDSEHFKVRDFGFGIRHDAIGPIYGVYGSSTKKNDGRQTGGFGLGCKAPFAYTEHFEVISHHVGLKTIYNMSKSNAVAKGKPGIITIASFPTDECGLQVNMPIRGKDWVRFKEVIRRIVSNGEMKATLNDELLPVIPFSQAPHGYVLTTDAVMGETTMISHTRRNPILLRYGNVIYPIEPNEELNALYGHVNRIVGGFTGYALILQAPPDSISVTPSRESLSMQEHTVETLKKLFRAFLAHAKGLTDEILIQGKTIIDLAVADKHYPTLFSQGWGQKYVKDAAPAYITDLTGMARYHLGQNYPNSLKFRLQDVDYRIRKASEAKLVDGHLAATFLKELPTVKEIPAKYTYTPRKHSSDWLHRRVLGKLMVKLRAANMDDTTLYVLDEMQHKYYDAFGDNKLIPARQATSRNHLNNMPFLRKTIVVTTALTQLQDRIRAYARNNPGSPQDGMLCYHIRARKADRIVAALDLFTKLGYEIIDFTKRHSWEGADPKPAAPRKKPEPYPGLPALSNIQTPNSINTQRFRSDTNALILPTPELVLTIGARTSNTLAIENFSTLATKMLVRLYGSRVGIAKDKNEYNRAIKHGAVDFLTVLNTELQDMLLRSPTVAEYFAYDFTRVKQDLHSWQCNLAALKLIYQDPDLRKEFGLKYNLTNEEAAMVTVFNHSTGLSDTCRTAVDLHVNAIPLGPENAVAIAAVTKNELLVMLDTSNVKAGLASSKRQTYLDIFIKVLKG